MSGIKGAISLATVSPNTDGNITSIDSRGRNIYIGTDLGWVFKWKLTLQPNVKASKDGSVCLVDRKRVTAVSHDETLPRAFALCHETVYFLDTSRLGVIAPIPETKGTNCFSLAPPYVRGCDGEEVHRLCVSIPRRRVLLIFNVSLSECTLTQQLVLPSQAHCLTFLDDHVCCGHLREYSLLHVQDGAANGLLQLQNHLPLSTLVDHDVLLRLNELCFVVSLNYNSNNNASASAVGAATATNAGSSPMTHNGSITSTLHQHHHDASSVVGSPDHPYSGSSSLTHRALVSNSAAMATAAAATANAAGQLKFSVRFESEPLAFAYQHPYILGMQRDYIDVYSIYEQRIIQRMSIPECALGTSVGVKDCLITASRSKVYVLRLHPLDDQLWNLALQGRIDEATSLLYHHHHHEGVDDPDVLQQKEVELNVMAGIAYLHNADPDNCMLHLNAHVDVREVLAHCPELKPIKSAEHADEPLFWESWKHVKCKYNTLDRTLEQRWTEYHTTCGIAKDVTLQHFLADRFAALDSALELFLTSRRDSCEDPSQQRCIDYALLVLFLKYERYHDVVSLCCRANVSLDLRDVRALVEVKRTPFLYRILLLLYVKHGLMELTLPLKVERLALESKYRELCALDDAHALHIHAPVKSTRMAELYQTRTSDSNTSNKNEDDNNNNDIHNVFFATSCGCVTFLISVLESGDNINNNINNNNSNTQPQCVLFSAISGTPSSSASSHSSASGRHYSPDASAPVHSAPIGTVPSLTDFTSMFSTGDATTTTHTTHNTDSVESPHGPFASFEDAALSDGQNSPMLLSATLTMSDHQQAPARNRRATTNDIRLNRVRSVLKDRRKNTDTEPSDAKNMRLWYMWMHICVFYSYVVFTLTLTLEADTGSLTHEVLRSLVSLVFAIDVYIHWRHVRPTYPLMRSMFDVVVCVPWHLVLLVAGVSDTGTDAASRTLSCVVAAVPALKLARVPHMFSTSMPDVIDAHYVIFYFRVLPTARFVFWFLVNLHGLVVLRQLCAAPGTSTSYYDALNFVWIMLTSAPVTVEVAGDWEPILSGFLMTISMVLQGYVVGAMSMLVFGYNVKEENRKQMLTTLEMLRHYQLPRAARDEVLSFQHHTLTESSVRASSHATLDKLPPSMLRQIQLYMKVQVLSTVPLFADASQSCRHVIADVMVQLVVEPDTDIIVAGDVGNTMYFILHGLADVILPNGLCVATLRRGDFFGEIALLSVDSLRKATVSSLTYCDLLELSRGDFDGAIERFPEFHDMVAEKRAAMIQAVAGAGLPVVTVAPSASGSSEAGSPRRDTTLGSTFITMNQQDDSEAPAEMVLSMSISRSSPLLKFSAGALDIKSARLGPVGRSFADFVDDDSSSSGPGGAPIVIPRVKSGMNLRSQRRSLLMTEAQLAGGGASLMPSRHRKSHANANVTFVGQPPTSTSSPKSGARMFMSRKSDPNGMSMGILSRTKSRESLSSYTSRVTPTHMDYAGPEVESHAGAPSVAGGLLGDSNGQLSRDISSSVLSISMSQVPAGTALAMPMHRMSSGGSPRPAHRQASSPLVPGDVEERLAKLLNIIPDHIVDASSASSKGVRFLDDVRKPSAHTMSSLRVESMVQTDPVWSQQGI
eukprot:PhM_4_TR18425/c6_g2_i2/m.85291